MTEIKQIYYDPKTGLTSEDKLYRRLKQLDPNITKKDVKEFLSSQEVNQVFKQRNVKYYFPLSSYSPLPCPNRFIRCFK